MWIIRSNLAIVKELGDRAAQGRTLGNLGNTYYLLGNFRNAVASHEQVWESPDHFLLYQEFSVNMSCNIAVSVCVSAFADS